MVGHTTLLFPQGIEAYLPREVAELGVKRLDGPFNPLNLGDHARDGNHYLHHDLLEAGVDARRHGLELGCHAG